MLGEPLATRGSLAEALRKCRLATVPRVINIFQWFESPMTAKVSRGTSMSYPGGCWRPSGTADHDLLTRLSRRSVRVVDEK